MIWLALTLLLIATHALAADRVDLFDTLGNRTGYAIVDRQTGRAEYFDAQSRRTGYGTVDATGRADRFDLKGRREGTTVVPVIPAPTAR